MLPGLPSGSAVPSYAGMALGSAHTEADVRGEVDWAALAVHARLLLDTRGVTRGLVDGTGNVAAA